MGGKGNREEVTALVQAGNDDDLDQVGGGGGGDKLSNFNTC